MTIVFDLDLTPDAVETERLAVAHLSDVELLAAIVRACDEIVDIADPAMVLAQFPESEWKIEEIVPLNPDLQTCLLWHIAAEALAIATFALGQRASATALAQVRVICDAYCLLRWLKEPADEDARKARTIGFVMSELEDAVRVYKNLPGDEEKQKQHRVNMAGARDLRGWIEESARRSGITPQLPPETARDLYEAFFPPGYGVYTVLSDVGSHVGLRFLREFFLEGGGPSFTHRMDFVAGGLRPRCFYLGIGYCVYAALAELVAWYFRFESGMQPAVRNHFRAHRALLFEGQRRINALWLGDPPPSETS